jgi:GTPase SAR1 family protein
VTILGAYDRLRPLSYPCSDIFFVCFSVVNHASFDSIATKWVPEVTYHLPTCPIMLIGLKTDLRDDQETVNDLAAKNLLPITYDQVLACNIKSINQIGEDKGEGAWPR